MESPITSWQIDGEKVETVTDFILLGSKITVDGECSHKIKGSQLLGRKAMANIDSIKQQQRQQQQQQQLRHHSADQSSYNQSYGGSDSKEYTCNMGDLGSIMGRRFL